MPVSPLRLFLGRLAVVLGALFVGLPALAAEDGLARALGGPPAWTAPAAAVSLEPSQPGASDWVHTDQASVRLIAARDATGTEQTVRLGLEFDLRPGWKVYWRSPGDAGYPPSIDWAGSDNLDDATFAWPVPHRFELFGLQTAGYEDHVVLPITARVVQPGQPVHLSAAVDYLICADICIPGDADLALALPAGPGGPTEFTHLIEQFQATVPSDGHGIALAAAEIIGGNTFRVTVTADPPLVGPDLFVEGPMGDGQGDGVVSGAPDVRLAEGGRRAVFTAPLLAAYAPQDGPPLRFTVVDGARGLEATAVPGIGVVEAGGGPGLGLATILGLALLGGLILNLMPCVLPVLSLKVMGFVAHGGAGRAEVRAAFLASAAGVITAFMVLAAALMALKLAGAAVGWGIQFQQPLFLVAMIALLTLFAANLWGLFEVPLPGWLAGSGGSLGAPRTLAGHFSAGAFATLLATPCSAPFLGTAVGFALARGPLEIALIFAALGVGMALPYLGIAAVPSLAQRLPRPGAWMIWLRRVLGFALAGTAVWLLSVLMATVGSEGSLLVAGLMAAVLAALALRRLAAEKLRPVAAVAVVALVAGAFAVPLIDRPSVASAPVPSGLWQAWSPEAVAAEVAAGRVVFVDVTADWCITCQVNKAAVIERGAVLAALSGPDVTALVADWTRPDAAIAAYLESFGRYGIPFNAVYGPGAPQGIALPELLSTDAVLEALDTAAGRAAAGS